MTVEDQVTATLMQAGYGTVADHSNLQFNQVFSYQTVIIFTQWFKSISSMSDSWRNLQNQIAAEVQPTLKGSRKWDIYLVFFSRESITEETLRLVEDIQNDTFCCRKIVIQATSKEEIESGLGQLPYIMPSQGRDRVVSSIRDFFVKQFQGDGIGDELVGKLLDKSPEEVAELLIKASSDEAK